MVEAVLQLDGIKGLVLVRVLGVLVACLGPKFEP